MACFWKNERNAVEVCPITIDNGSYTYTESDTSTTPATNYLVVVPQDLASYAKIPISVTSTLYTSIFSLFSKQGNVYSVGYREGNLSLTSFYKFSADGGYTRILGVPDIIPSHADHITHTAGKLRATRSGTTDWSSQISFYESANGETWVLVPGTTSGSAAAATRFIYHYTVLSSRLIGISLAAASSGVYGLYYSDDGGATWANGTGSDVASSGNTSHPFVHSGANIIATHRGGIFVSSDGATWAHYPDVIIPTLAFSRPVAASGTGLVVVAGTIQSSGLRGFAHSGDHGATWATTTQVAGGIPDASVVFSLFWDGVRFVGFIQRGDTGVYQIYTSPTGAAWTAGLVVPTIHKLPTQVID